MGAADMAQVVPELRERLPDSCGGSPLGGTLQAESSGGHLPSPPRDPLQERFRFFDAVTTLLRNASRAQPLVLIFDDLHWADTPSLLLLQFLARELRGARLLVVGTYRDVEVDRRHPLTQALAELARHPNVARIPLRGLGEPDVARFVELTTGRRWREDLMAAIYRETEGNPFFIAEVARLLASEGRPEDARLHRLTIPQSVREVIGRRLNHVSAACNRVLSLAAVFGREFSVVTLTQASGGDREGDGVLDAMEEASAARIVVNVPGCVDRYRFSHALIRETLYDELGPATRVRLHRRAGEALEEVHQADLEAHVAELAAHFFQAAIGGDVEKATRYAVAAAERAGRLFAYEEAVRHYEMALQALQLKQPVDAEEQRCELLLGLGRARARAGDTAKAKEAAWQAVAVARKLAGSPEAGSLLARAALGVGGSGWETGMVDDALVGLLEEALRALGPQDSALRACVLSRLAGELAIVAAPERVTALSREAVEMARRVGDAAALASALNARHFVLWAPEHVEERLAIATEMVRLAEAVGDRGRSLLGRRWRITNLMEKGEVAAADTEIESYARLADDLRQPVYAWFTAVSRAMQALFDGRFAEAEHLVQQARTAGERAQEPNARIIFTVQMFVIRREQGRLHELEPILREFSGRHPAIPGWRAQLALAYGELGRADEARREFEYLAADGFAGLPRNWIWLPAVMFLAEVGALLADTRRAALLYDLLLPYAACNVTNAGGTVGACYGPVARYLGLLAATMSRWDEAQAHFETALALSARMGARPWVAHAQYDYATALVNAESEAHREKAIALLDQALAAARELGMPRLTEKARQARTGDSIRFAQGRRGTRKPVGPPAGPALRAPRSDFSHGLTAREAEVLCLLAAGHSNKEIAEALTVSLPTVERHVFNIYQKIGARGRAEATAYALRHGLLAISDP